MNKDDLSLAEQIEYYLGKDKLPNLHWQPTIPASWEIPPRHAHMMTCNPDSRNVTLTLDDGIEYQFNNLGYRSVFDYVVDDLKDKNIILILGDSDTFARGVHFDCAYSSVIQKSTDYCVVNLGISGLSADGVARVGTVAMQALGSAVKHVCVLWPGFSLREFVSKKFKCGINFTSDHLPYTDWYDHIDWVSNNYNYQKNKLLLEKTTESIGAKYHDLIVNRQDKNTPTSYITVTSGQHTFTEFDATTHTAIANYFLRKINNQPSLFKQFTTQS